METSIERVDPNSETCYVKIGNEFIAATDSASTGDECLKSFFQRIQKTCSKKTKSQLIVALTVECASSYASAGFHLGRKGSDKYDLLQLFVGRECLVFYLWEASAYGLPPKALRDFLTDNRTVVVGVGMKKVAPILEKTHGLPIRKWVELRELVEVREGSSMGKKSVGDLARIVSEGKLDYQSLIESNGVVCSQRDAKEFQMT